MTRIEKIRRYIDRAGLSENTGYQMDFLEMLDLSRMFQGMPLDAIILSFKYGHAKGYRMAKSEVRK